MMLFSWILMACSVAIGCIDFYLSDAGLVPYPVVWVIAIAELLIFVSACVIQKLEADIDELEEEEEEGVMNSRDFAYCKGYDNGLKDAIREINDLQKAYNAGNDREVDRYVLLANIEKLKAHIRSLELSD